MTTKAIAFIPAGPLDEANQTFLQQCLAHCARRGYEVAGLIRGNWAAVLEMLAAGLASVVVFARQEHRDALWEPRAEYCGEITQGLFRLAPGADPQPGRRARLI